MSMVAPVLPSYTILPLYFGGSSLISGGNSPSISKRKDASSEYLMTECVIVGVIVVGVLVSVHDQASVRAHAHP